MSPATKRSKRFKERLGELLTFHRILADPSGLSEDNEDEAIMEFQGNAGILVDGVIGPDTLWRLQLPWALATDKLLFTRCEADVVPGIEGFESLLLREDAAKRYERLRSSVLEYGGIITTAGGRRGLKQEANASRSSKSMHYPALAFDLALTSGFFKPDTDPFVITRGDDGYWTVWCRASGGQQKELEAVYWEKWGSGVDKRKTVTDKFINFTDLCKEQGFHPIRPRKSFLRESNRLYLSSEWWHFQANDVLFPNVSQFGIELLRIDGYTAARIEAENSGVWGNRKAVYRESWF